MSIITINFLLFVTGVCILYFLSPVRRRWMVLLAASYVFYFFSGYKSFLFLLSTTLSTFYAALYLGKQNEKQPPQEANKDEKKKFKTKIIHKKRLILFAAAFLNFGILAFLKYFNYYAEILSNLYGLAVPQLKLGLLIPIGISFYTFQSISYIVDIYRGKYAPEKNLARYALFVSFFPQMVQGPIGRYDQLAPQLYEPHFFEYTRVKFGAQLMLWGFFKKLVIADNIRIIVDTIFNNYPQYPGQYLIFAVVLYTIQIYTDFSGGIDIIRGVAQMLGINMAQNFKRPYFSKSVAEFWRRWHITLGAWCRDYIFYPLTLSKSFGKLGKKSRKIFGNYIGKLLPVIISQFIVFFVIGLWHGASVKYLAFGLYYGVLIVASILLEPVFIKITKWLKVDTNTFSWRLFQILRTFAIVCFGRFFSRADSFMQALALIKSAFTHTNFNIYFNGSIFELGLRLKSFAVLILSICVLLFISILQERGVKMREEIAKQNLIFRWTLYIFALFAVLIFGAYGVDYNASDFVYRGF